MNISCPLVLKTCLPCNDDPISNLSAEAPDIDVFTGFRDFKWNPPLGVTYFQLACKSICFSQVSQQEADDCAQRQAQSCVWTGGEPPVVPPIPPGPNSNKGAGPNTPGGVPPANPRSPVPVFANKIQTCDAACPDGSLFTEFVAAGTITALSQALADAQAHSLACKRALQNLFCISAATPPDACVGEEYFFRLNSSGGLDLQWSLESGSLPPGLTLDSVNGVITGTPSSSGSFNFTVSVTDSSGRGQLKSFSICITDIVTATALPEAEVGQVYAQPLVQEPGPVASEVWSLVSGSLPPGITLASNGALNGTPTQQGPFEFTIKVDATCDGSSVSCQKTFNLEVVGVDPCIGFAAAVQDAVWTTNGYSLVIANGDGTFNHTAGASYVELGQTILCNPNGAAYDLTLDFAWSTASAIDPAAMSSQVTVWLNIGEVWVLAEGATSSPLESGAGGFTWNLVLALPPGVSHIVVQIGIFHSEACTLSGTVTVRPLTPP